MTAPALSLVVRRTIAASPARLFEAWTHAEQMKAWWGPRGVTCTHAEIDLRIGGSYRLDHALPDGRALRISGEFLAIVPPEKLVYTWRLEPGTGAVEQVTVRFEPRGTSTEVIIVHERIADEVSKDGHGAGWEGCLDGLDRYVAVS